MVYFPVYNKDTDYNTNAKSYYDYLARVNEFLKVMGIRLEEYDGILKDKLEEINRKIDALEPVFRDLMQKWLDDGTIEEIINVNIFNDLNTQIKNLDAKVRKNEINLIDIHDELDGIGTTRIERY